MRSNRNQDWEELRKEYLELLDSDRAGHGELWAVLWRLFLEDPSYQHQLHASAQSLLRRHRSRTCLLADIKQEAVLLLARKLRRAPDCFRTVGSKACFAPSICRTISQHCLEAFRQSRRHRGNDDIPEEVSDEVDYLQPHIDRRIDISQALDQLEDPARTILMLFSHGLDLRQISQQLKLGYWTTRRHWQHGLAEMARLLGADYEKK